jgi:BirA family transcriptional regulator, biotin operon repressor / biotin---[acetyl-CoA-carboxylase] ligase
MTPEPESTAQPESGQPAQPESGQPAQPESGQPAQPESASAARARAVAANPTQPQAVGPETVERYGRPMRVYPVAVSSEVMAQAWANKEAAPHGAAVVVEHEINPRGLHGALWGTPPSDTLACAVILRPSVAVEEAEITWLVGGLAAVEAAESITARSYATWWPDSIVERDTGDPVAAVKAEIQLGPGQVKSAVVTVRFDLLRLECDPESGRDTLLEALVGAFDTVAARLEEGAAGVATAFGERCAMLDKRVKVKLRPKGETRGVARRVDRAGRLEVESMSGMVERIGVNQLMELEVVERPQG